METRTEPSTGGGHVLLRQLTGDVLRQRRLARGLTMREVSARARISLGYISEVERGHKEPSSELLAALCRAVETPLSQVLRDVAALLEVDEAAQLPPVPATPAYAA